MPIINGTKETVGVEVSGPTRGPDMKILAIATAAGAAMVFAGLKFHEPILTVAGLLIATVSGVLLWRATRETKRHVEPVSLRSGAAEELPILTVLEPDGELDDPDRFNNLLVTFYRPTETSVRGEPIAAVDFNDVDYTVTYYPGGTDLRRVTEPRAMVEEPIRVEIRRNELMQYQVDVATA